MEYIITIYLIDNAICYKYSYSMLYIEIQLKWLVAIILKYFDLLMYFGFNFRFFSY